MDIKFVTFNFIFILMILNVLPESWVLSSVKVEGISEPSLWFCEVQPEKKKMLMQFLCF